MLNNMNNWEVVFGCLWGVALGPLGTRLLAKQLAHQFFNGAAGVGQGRSHLEDRWSLRTTNHEALGPDLNVSDIE